MGLAVLVVFGFLHPLTKFDSKPIQERKGEGLIQVMSSLSVHLRSSFTPERLVPASSCGFSN